MKVKSAIYMILIGFLENLSAMRSSPFIEVNNYTALPSRLLQFSITKPCWI